jgi:membrane-associated protein
MDYLLHFITTVGYWGYGIVFLIILLESFPPTFFLPGDSLLFISGFFASQGYFNLGLLILCLYAGSILGYIFSYAMGKKLRDFILRSNDRYWFKIKHLEYTESFYRRNGNKTIVIGRFVPIIRSFSPMLAGAVKMDYKKFLLLTWVGGFLWTGGLTLIGYYLGQLIPDAHKFVTPVVLCIIFVSLLPALFDVFMKKFKNK